MNERGRSRHNPDEYRQLSLHGFQPGSEALTSQGDNPYAKSGAKYHMAAEGTADNQQREANGQGQTEQTPLDRIKAELYQNFENMMGYPPRTVTERGILDQAAAERLVRSGQAPQTPTEMGGPMPRERKRELRDELRRQERTERAAADEAEALANATVSKAPSDRQWTEESVRDFERSVDELIQGGSMNIAQLDAAMEGLLSLTASRGGDDKYAAQISEIATRQIEAKEDEQVVRTLREQGIPPEQITEELKEVTREQLRTAKKPTEIIDGLKRDIVRATDLDTARNKFEWLRKYVKDVNENIANGNLKVRDETRDTLRDIVNLSDGDLNTVDKIKEQTGRILSDMPDGLNIRKFFTSIDTSSRSRGRSNIQSLEDLVDLIVDSQGGEFLPGKKYEIMNERGEIQLQNLVAWIRNRIVFTHNTDPDNPINILNEIRIPLLFGQLTLANMLYIPAYFQKRKTVITGTEDGATMKYENSTDKEYSRFKDDLLYESWLFGVSHNNDADYRAVRGQEEPLFNKIGQMYAKNEFTKGRDRLLNILNLSKADAGELEAVGNREKQGSVGKAIQRGVMAYYHLWEVLREDAKTPEDNNFYATLGADGTKYFYQSIVDQLLKAQSGTDIGFGRDLTEITAGMKRDNTEEVISDTELAFRQKKPEIMNLLINKFGLSQEQVDDFENNPRALADTLLQKVWNFSHKDLNIFDLVTKEQRLINLVSNGITHAVGRKEGLSSDDTEYAGTWAYTMRNWTGIAARNDTQGIGFDAWSKMINFKDYRTRQGQGRSGAGNRYNLPGFNRLSVTLLDGLRVKVEDEGGKERSLTSVLEESVRNNTDIKTFDFEGEAMKQFAANHINNAYKVFTFILEKQELKMHSFLKEDQYGRMVFDQEAAFKLMDGPWHDLRYAFDQPRFDYDNTLIKGWVNEVEYDSRGKPVRDETGKIKTKRVYKEQTLRHYMFGEDMIHLAEHLYEREITGRKPTDKIRKDAMARAAFGYLLAKEIYAHRKWDSGYPLWTVEHIMELQEFFHHQALEFGQAEEGSLDVKVFEPFFDHHEWHAIMHAIKLSYGKLYTGMVARQLGQSILGGVVNTISQTAKQVAKTG